MYRKFFSALTLTLLVLTFALPISVSAAESVPAGCPGGPAGSPSPGTVCPDGTVPVPDNTLPYGCKGSSLLGPPSEGAVCPARPGREACTITKGVCVAAADQPKFVKSDCKGNDIQAGLPEDDPNHCGILDYLQLFINVLSGIVGVVIVAMMVIGGIQYSASGDNPQAVGAAKKRIANALLALFVFVFMIAFLNWLVPGGVFR